MTAALFDRTSTCINYIWIYFISLNVIYALWCFCHFLLLLKFRCHSLSVAVSLLVILILFSSLAFMGERGFHQSPSGFPVSLQLCVFLFLEFSYSADTLIRSDLHSPGRASVFGSRVSLNIILFLLLKPTLYLSDFLVLNQLK